MLNILKDKCLPVLLSIVLAFSVSLGVPAQKAQANPIAALPVAEKVIITALMAGVLALNVSELGDNNEAIEDRCYALWSEFCDSTDAEVAKQAWSFIQTQATAGHLIFSLWNSWLSENVLKPFYQFCTTTQGVSTLSYGDVTLSYKTYSQSGAETQYMRYYNGGWTDSFNNVYRTNPVNSTQNFLPVATLYPSSSVVRNPEQVTADGAFINAPLGTLTVGDTTISNAQLIGLNIQTNQLTTTPFAFTPDLNLNTDGGTLSGTGLKWADAWGATTPDTPLFSTLVGTTIKQAGAWGGVWTDGNGVDVSKLTQIDLAANAVVLVYADNNPRPTNDNIVGVYLAATGVMLTVVNKENPVTDNPDTNIGANEFDDGKGIGADNQPVGADAAASTDNPDVLNPGGSVGLAGLSNLDWSNVNDWADALNALGIGLTDAAAGSIVNALTKAWVGTNEGVKEKTIEEAQTKPNTSGSNIGGNSLGGKFDWSWFLMPELYLVFPFCIPWDVLSLWETVKDGSYVSTLDVAETYSLSDLNPVSALDAATDIEPYAYQDGPPPHPMQISIPWAVAGEGVTLDIDFSWILPLRPYILLCSHIVWILLAIRLCLSIGEGWGQFAYKDEHGSGQVPGK